MMVFLLNLFSVLVVVWKLLGFVVLGASQQTTCLGDALSAPVSPVLAVAGGMIVMSLSFVRSLFLQEDRSESKKREGKLN